MEYSKELEELIKEKEFKTFWHCFEFLNFAGYNSFDSFGISLREFGDNNVFANVAFIDKKIDVTLKDVKPYYAPLEHRPFEFKRDTFVEDGSVYSIITNSANAPFTPAFVGPDLINERGENINLSFNYELNIQLNVSLMNETNIHLSGLYNVYREKRINMVMGGNSSKLETCCEKIEVSDLSGLLFETLGDIAKRHYGYDMLGNETKGVRYKDTLDVETLAVTSYQKLLAESRETKNTSQNSAFYETGRAGRNNGDMTNDGGYTDAFGNVRY